MKTNMIELDVNELCRRLVNKMRLKTALTTIFSLMILVHTW